MEFGGRTPALAVKGQQTASPKGASSRYFGGSKPAARQRSASAGPASAAMKACAAAGSVLLAGIAAA